MEENQSIPRTNGYDTEPPRKYLQEELLENVSDAIQIDRNYIILLVFSTLIAVLGLLTDSAAVVIGAMLISPLFWPILGLTLSVITNRRHLARRSTMNLIISTLVILLIGIIVARISPLNQITSEISSRTTPTLLDLFIALAASIIGVLAIYNPRISQSTSGVAISIALLPALCVSGIGIAFGSWEIFLGSFLLFATNMGAIIFCGVITLYLLKFRPRRESEKNRMKYGLAISFVFLFTLSIPLSYFLFQSLSQNRLISQTNELLIAHLQQVTTDSRIDNLDVKFPPTLSREKVQITATVFLPEGYSLTNTQQSQMISDLSTLLNRDIDLELNLVNSLVLRKEEDETVRQLKQDIRASIVRMLLGLPQQVVYNTIDVRVPLDSNDKPIEVLIVIKELADDVITYQQKDQIQAALIAEYGKDFNIEVEFIPIRRLSDLSAEERLITTIESLINDEVRNLGDDFSLANLEVVFTQLTEGSTRLEATDTASLQNLGPIQVNVVLYAPESVEELGAFTSELNSYLTNQIGIPIQVQIRLISYR